METQHYLLNRVADIRSAQKNRDYVSANKLFAELLSLLTEEEISVEYAKSNDLGYVESVIAQAVASQA